MPEERISNGGSIAEERTPWERQLLRNFGTIRRWNGQGKCHYILIICLFKAKVPISVYTDRVHDNDKVAATTNRLMYRAHLATICAISRSQSLWGIGQKANRADHYIFNRSLTCVTLKTLRGPHYQSQHSNKYNMGAEKEKKCQLDFNQKQQSKHDQQQQ